jgi:hypothetical protein
MILAVPNCQVADETTNIVRLAGRNELRLAERNRQVTLHGRKN